MSVQVRRRTYTLLSVAVATADGVFRRLPSTAVRLPVRALTTVAPIVWRYRTELEGVVETKPTRRSEISYEWMKKCAGRMENLVPGPGTEASTFCMQASCVTAALICSPLTGFECLNDTALLNWKSIAYYFSGCRLVHLELLLWPLLEQFYNQQCALNIK